MYIQWLTTKEVMPQLQLVAFDRMMVISQTFVTFKFTIRASQFAVWTQNKGFIVEEGRKIVTHLVRKPHKANWQTVPIQIRHRSFFFGLFSYRSIKEFLKIFLAETSGPISVFGRNFPLMTQYQDCSSRHVSSEKNGPHYSSVSI